MKIATSGTREGIIKIVNEYFFSSNYVLREVDGRLFAANEKTGKLLPIQHKKGRFIFEM